MNLVAVRVGCAALFAFFAPLGSNARAQFVPVRELDSNRAATGPGGRPYEVIGGVAAGWLWTSQPTAVFWDGNGSNLLPPLPKANQSYAYGFNSSLVVVGKCSKPAGDFAVRWTAGVAEDLGKLVTSGPTLDLDWANDIEERGRIVGRAHDPATGLVRAFLFDAGTLTDLGSLNGGADGAIAVRVNDHLVAVGSSTDVTTYVSHACQFSLAAGVVDLHDAAVMGASSSIATDVARDGRTVGSFSVGLMPKPFLWDGAAVIDLSTIVPNRGQALGMNDFGDIVGWYDPIGTGTTYHMNPFLIHDGVMIDLNSLVDPTSGWILVDAIDIDNEGRIVGSGTLNTRITSYILEPVSKGTFTVYGSGCAGTYGLVPRMRGAGRPSPDQDFAIEILDGLPGCTGLLVLGTGNGTATLKPGCDVQVLPIVPPLIPLLLDGFGESWLATRLPTGTPVFDVYLQALFFDPGAAYGISATNPLAMHFE